MKRKNLCVKFSRENQSEANSAGHNMLVRGGYIHQTMQGAYTFSPIGFRVLDKIKNTIRKEMNALNGQEILMPLTCPASLWKESGRYGNVDVLTTLKNKAGVEIALNPTHEETVTDFVRSIMQSYKQFPFMVYQIQSKYRNELRVKSGLLRTREFLMKDAYSFHTSQKDLEDYYEKCLKAYGSFFENIGLKTLAIESDNGDMGGDVSHEFMVLSEHGEDTIFVCEKCGLKANKEIFENKPDDKCPKCGAAETDGFKKLRGIEAGNIFQLGNKYTETMKCSYLNENGKKQAPIMGCYGIGLSRVMGCIAEIYADEKGIAWPKKVAPFDVHLIVFKGTEIEEKNANDLYESLKKNGFDVLLDERKKISMGEKLSEADLIGSPIRVIFSPKNTEQDKVEIQFRNGDETVFCSLSEVEKYI
ncbi:MAG: proline--tRNA ligase [Alphaproteobacteria bacterium]|nr:MAG: hypothetical protein B6I23_01515 [Rickettsiaceae bacterium 4572_127]